MKELLVIFCSLLAFSVSKEMIVGFSTPADDQCHVAINEIINEDRETVVDESPNRLHATWISEECELRAGPEYLIRKYRFLENETFYLMRHYYAEDSCSIPTHTITARGSIKLLTSSVLTGATETRYTLDTVDVLPLNRQVAQKLGHRVNSSCGPQPRWQPYEAQLIYERLTARTGPNTQSKLYEDPKHNKLQGHTLKYTSKTQNSLDCLHPLGLDFEELKLLRVQKRPSFRAAGVKGDKRPKVELYLAALPQDVLSKRMHRATSLQPTGLLRTDTIHNCPACGAITSGTVKNPPLLHEGVALPALLGGSWLSPNCESRPGGIWLRRQLRVYPGDRLWTGRWDYFVDPRCSIFLYGITAAGSYVQRTRRHHRHQNPTVIQHKHLKPDNTFWMMQNLENVKTKRAADETDYYRHLLQSAQPSMADSFAAMLRGNQRPQDDPTKKPNLPVIPSGITELDLHVAESFLIPGDASLAKRCGGNPERGKRQYLNNWIQNCVPHSVEAPSTISLKAKIGTDWFGQYTLSLGPKDGLWDAPLLQCGQTTAKNPLLRLHLRRSVGLRFGVLFTSAGSKRTASSMNLVVLTILLLKILFLRAYL